MSKKHPTAEELIAYSNDNLNDANEMNFIKGHLDNCDICFQLVTDYSIKGIDINKQQKILNELNKTIFEDSNEYRKVIEEMNSKMFIETEEADNAAKDNDDDFNIFFGIDKEPFPTQGDYFNMLNRPRDCYLALGTLEKT